MGLLVVVVALGAGPAGALAPAARDVPVLAGRAGAHVAEVLARSALPELGALRVEVPRGYATVASRAAAAAAAAPAQTAAVAAVPAEVTAAAPAAPPPAPAPAPQGLPPGVDPGGARQVVTVAAPSAGSTSARLTAWELGPTGWAPVLGPVPARVGSAGVGAASETTARTPAGTFSLTEAFGRAGDPGTALPYRVVDGQDWWVSDVASPLYNQHVRCAPSTCPFDESVSENLQAAGGVYDMAVVIDYNRGGTPGAGSAFFLHVSNGAPTAGCVAIDAGALAALLRWLDPAAGPLIAIGIG